MTFEQHFTKQIEDELKRGYGDDVLLHAYVEIVEQTNDRSPRLLLLRCPLSEMKPQIGNYEFVEMIKDIPRFRSPRA